jgi:hypothetical protein
MKASTGLHWSMISVEALALTTKWKVHVVTIRKRIKALAKLIIWTWARKTPRLLATSIPWLSSSKHTQHDMAFTAQRPRRSSSS